MTIADSTQSSSSELALPTRIDPALRSELNSLLKQVSRSFYLTLRVLPREVRSQIGLAYLLARATDTVADTAIVPVADRLATLAALRDRIAGTSSQQINLSLFGSEPRAGASTRAASAGERIVLARIEQFIAALKQFAASDRALIAQVLSVIISGQELDLRRFAGASAEKVVALRTQEELDDYTYRVAGCVGEFWTRICRSHLFPKDSIDEGSLLQKGVRFGKGLQLVNVLRDLPADLREGRCYVPQERLEALGLSPADLLKVDSFGAFRPLYIDLIALAESHLEAGWEYTNSIPHRLRRVRLACAWPVLIGVATLAKLRRFNVLDGSMRVKVSRPEVRRTIFRTIIGSFAPQIWSRLFADAKLV